MLFEDVGVGLLVTVAHRRLIMRHEGQTVARLEAHGFNDGVHVALVLGRHLLEQRLQTFGEELELAGILPQAAPMLLVAHLLGIEAPLRAEVAPAA